MATIQIKRGLRANIPSTALNGELILTTDDQQLSVGNVAGTAVVPIKIAGANIVGGVAGAEQTANKDAASGYAGLTAGTLLKAAEFPAPTTSTFGGVKDIAAVATKFVSAITSGVPILTQPAFTDLSGTLAAGQLPATIDGGTF
jgi:hypothetical protein